MRSGVNYNPNLRLKSRILHQTAYEYEKLIADMIGARFQVRMLLCNSLVDGFNYLVRYVRNMRASFAGSNAINKRDLRKLAL